MSKLKSFDTGKMGRNLFAVWLYGVGVEWLFLGCWGGGFWVIGSEMEGSVWLCRFCGVGGVVLICDQGEGLEQVGRLGALLAS